MNGDAMLPNGYSGGIMRKGVLTVGIICLLVGLILIASSNVQQASTRKQVNKKVENKWSVSGYFKQGNNLSLYFVRHYDWSLPLTSDGLYMDRVPYGGTTLPAKILEVNITNVEINNYTLFKVTLVAPVQYAPLIEKGMYNFPLVIYSIEVLHHGAIGVEDAPDEVRGIIKNDGLYLVNCSLVPNVVMDKYVNGSDWFHEVGPPDELWLYEITTEIEHPYALFLPLGTLVVVSGAAVSIWSVREKKRKLRK